MTGLRLLALVVTAASAGCGLISSDVTNFDLTLPDKSFSIDTQGWQVDNQQAQTFLGVSCASQPTVCSNVQMACSMGCSGTCNATSKTCDLSLDVALHQMVNLLAEKPELESINDKPVIKVEIDSVTYEVTANTLNVATPAMNVFVAPLSVTDPKDASAKLIGTVPAIDAGSVTDKPQTLEFTATGKADLIATMSTFKTPFNVLVGSALVVHQGTPVPTGKLDAVIHIKAHAGL